MTKRSQAEIEGGDEASGVGIQQQLTRIKSEPAFEEGRNAVSGADHAALCPMMEYYA